MRTTVTTKPDIQRRWQKGFSMLEVLVSVLVLAIGLLGLAALQSRALQFSHDAYVRGQAAILASDMVERMRSVRGGSAAGQQLSAFADATAGTCEATDRATATADSEVKCWMADVASQLPGGVADIQQNGGDANRYDITIQWTDRENLGTRTLTWTVMP